MRLCGKAVLRAGLFSTQTAKMPAALYSTEHALTITLAAAWQQLRVMLLATTCRVVRYRCWQGDTGSQQQYAVLPYNQGFEVPGAGLVYICICRPAETSSAMEHVKPTHPQQHSEPLPEAVLGPLLPGSSGWLSWCRSR